MDKYRETATLLLNHLHVYLESVHLATIVSYVALSTFLLFLFRTIRCNYLLRHSKKQASNHSTQFGLGHEPVNQPIHYAAELDYNQDMPNQNSNSLKLKKFQNNRAKLAIQDSGVGFLEGIGSDDGLSRKVDALSTRIGAIEAWMQDIQRQLSSIVPISNHQSGFSSTHNHDIHETLVVAPPPPPPPPPPMNLNHSNKLVIVRSEKTQEETKPTMSQVLKELSSLKVKVGSLINSPRSTYLTKRTHGDQPKPPSRLSIVQENPFLTSTGPQQLNHVLTSNENSAYQGNRAPVSLADAPQYLAREIQAIRLKKTDIPRSPGGTTILPLRRSRRHGGLHPDSIVHSLQQRFANAYPSDMDGASMDSSPFSPETK
ncbi:hypothetical protein BATDEDRAFT_85740 [Batrachochytrium dendrobatidis JAM81]|uniref:Uncharacterized protein n=1 Tax=Batrachochytrium dendrobatidis (strain JAM81 / FGSC 10211) TaxID=684364 RepID=F4NT38_BATDJ|nr:uncharacterized protein BATDEDRAFT_85740 [Batrachochytrium dendrobatidis JAM81]EGF83079.1 hypothetical protein BATDEDRAFT_85740 [Batrachochytrium dendrobatidis JAM81]|eukprot:XP_006675974.1 hypothetical protein BATDEDRAFT_85740 [Batrachochytrium dendrobatidis JAM81]